MFAGESRRLQHVFGLRAQENLEALNGLNGPSRARHIGRERERGRER